MRTSIIQVVLASLLACSGAVYGAELSDYEKTCLDLGFKKRTSAYGECVLELDKRSTDQQKQAERARGAQQRQTQEQQELQRAARGDGSPDHQTCAGFGFVAGTTPYSECRMRISIAKREAQQRQASFDAEQQRYETERQEYEAKVAEQKKQKQVDAWLKASQFFFALGSGQSPNFSENVANAGRVVSGQPPMPPRRPQMQNFTITSPSGRLTTCTTMGNHVDCF